MATINVSGIREAKAALQRLAAKVPAATQAAVRKGLEPVLAEAKALTPIESGELLDATTLRDVSAKGAHAEAEVIVDSDHAAAEEFGTKDRPGTRFLTRALDNKRDEAARAALREFGRQIGV